jgi:hypothetical protein
MPYRTTRQADQDIIDIYTSGMPDFGDAGNSVSPKPNGIMRDWRQRWI